MSETITKTTTKITKPSMYKVLLLNDDYTPMEFVVQILMEFFNKSPDEAAIIMLKIHNEGRGVAGIYPKDISEHKAADTIHSAKLNGFPLQAIVEKE